MKDLLKSVSWPNKVLFITSIAFIGVSVVSSRLNSERAIEQMQAYKAAQDQHLEQTLKQREAKIRQQATERAIAHINEQYLSLKTSITGCNLATTKVKQLSCYKNLAYSIKPELKQQQAAGDWVINKALDDAGSISRFHLSLPSKQQMLDENGDVKQPQLILSCEQGQASALIEWQFPMGGGIDSINVTSQFNRESPFQQAWQIAHKASMTQLNKGVFPFIEQLLVADSLKLTVNPEVYATPLKAEFELDGLAGNIDKFYAVCAKS